jgi:hypothetical protein
MSIVFVSQLAQNAYAQQLDLSINQRIYAPGDTLVVFGKGIPNDSMLVELFNPESRIVMRTQIDTGKEGSFSRILLIWPNPDPKDYRLGTYTLTVRSSTDVGLRGSEAFIFQSIAVPTPAVERQLTVQLSVPSVIGKNEVATVIVQVSVNGVLVKVDASKALKDSHTHFPDGSIQSIESFTVLEDGIYLTNFNSSMIGHHTIHIQATHQGLITSSVSGVFVEEGPILSLGNEIASLNANVVSLRQETVGKTEEISNAVSNIGSAAGQVTSLLLPIIGMIAIIVALQATILARRGKPSDAVKHET